MSRVCELTNRKKSFGNKVSHSNRKAKRIFLLNLHNVTLISNILNKKFKFRVAIRTLRTIDYKGNLDAFLLNTRTVKLSKKAQKIKRKLKKVLAKQEVELGISDA
ncbi:50S ribosomal protein L28 [Wolbachia endosymbiont of Brugia malayi]|uniref:Large ribosomal subunit protein bL28 n=1 Tax=Wolbachia sp. subsp. Brugia malayi (strain TRS) TaxID=292805 RepID=RL28_WOLTR|nr:MULTISPECIES: 50S ribosomal protein L28 [unclassified Wolbachia]Q5GSY3.1 RecName: Full=Large ribosomal subunit protein bL28; AltName: Full=50S ribosomal protein L28 [Wolbachia endosymbiont strain TRS of Brugia malayi]AAW70891.1 Ribosomal protein L28 [Wolbachia endosymbiont strain TRS of Brugia malayi]QCB61851.1 50S ribosomal protein L28 [Wolbachia endosymbiont of Brugia malayi]QIT36221.1 ribosomal protein L28 [Wolbachia endosymbiont of Brugia pahangi]